MTRIPANTSAPASGLLPSTSSPRGAVVWVIRALALVGLSVSGYLSWESFSSGDGEMFGCGFSQLVDCQHVLNSPWARWFGLPVSLGGLGVYASIFVVCMMVGPRVDARWRRFGWAALLALTVAAAGSAAWFIYIQAILVGSFCTWCMVVHTCSLGLAVCVIWFGPVSFRPVAPHDSVNPLRQSLGIEAPAPSPATENGPLVAPRATACLVACGVAATLVLIVGQQFASQGMVVELAASPIEDGDGAVSHVAAEPTDDPPSRGAAEHDVEPKPSADPIPPPSDTPAHQNDVVPSDSPPVEQDVTAPGAPQTAVGAVLNAAEAEQDPLSPAAGSVKTAPVNTAPDGAVPDLDNSSDTVDSSSGHETTTELAAPLVDVVPIEAKPTPPAVTPVEPERWERKLLIYNGRDQLDLDEHIVTGKTGAPYVIVTLFDYTCSHCRHMHSALNLIRQRYGDQLAVVHVPAPLNVSCNPYVKRTAKAHRDACYLARLGLMVWRVKPSAFAQFDDWLFKSPRSRSEARARAVELIGSQELNNALLDPWITRHLRRCVQVHNGSGSTGLPVTLIGRRTAKGQDATVQKTAATLFRLMESELAITPATVGATSR